MKLFERLKIEINSDAYKSIKGCIETAKAPIDPARHYDRAWDKFNLADSHSLAALLSYYIYDAKLTTEHGRACIVASEEFLFGGWRGEFPTPEKKIDSAWWKRRMIWMQIFEEALLWGSTFGEWEFLRRVGDFPEADSCISDGYRPQDRDLYVAWAALLRESPVVEIERLLERAEAGVKKSCKLVASMIRAASLRDRQALQRTFNEWMKYYRKKEFIKKNTTKKISFEGTFFVHWSRRAGIPVEVSAENIDHIVRLDS